MIGWINLSVEQFVITTFGEEAWNKVIAESGVEVGWVSSCPYPDKITYDLVITAAGILGVTVEQALEAYGVYFVNYVTEQGYTKLLKTLGSTIVELMANLNNLHLHLSNGQPAMDAPAFRVDEVTETSCQLHYFSRRPALWPIVVGVLKGLSKEYLHYDLTVTLKHSRDTGHDHEVFLVEYPVQTIHNRIGAKDIKAALPTTAAAAAPSPAAPTTFTLTPQLYMELHPFHILMDKDCRVLQFGAVLARVVPGIAPGVAVADILKVRHPFTDLRWECIVVDLASSFVLQVPSSGLELKGQMIPTELPIPGCPVAKPVLLFMGSPRLANLEEMVRHQLYLSDIPLHDLSRDFVLLAEQRQAEADLKEKFEKLTIEIKAEKARSDALVQRMSGLLACFPFKGAKGKDNDDLESSLGMSHATFSSNIAGTDESSGRMEVIEAVRRTLGGMNMKQSEQDTIELVEAIGEGTYGKVWKALWQGSEVAVKTIILPAQMSGSQKREKMAVMEAAISSTLSHPNIVQTYTYLISPLREDPLPHIVTTDVDATAMTVAPQSAQLKKVQEVGTTMGGSHRSGTTADDKAGAIHSYEVKLVLELCDNGSLRDAMEQRAFVLPDGSVNYAAVLDTAMDLAKGCIHMHRHGVLHCDIKARNVLLRGSGGTGRGVTAKIADFGLAVKLQPGARCVENMLQGTLTHMAPEVLLKGEVSKASDVYAFGITLWEIISSGSAFKGMPKALLIHQVTQEHRRPEFPPNTPQRYRQLAEWCWNKDVSIRPTFEEILPLLVSMRKEIPGPTPPLVWAAAKEPATTALARVSLVPDADVAAAMDTATPQGRTMDSHTATGTGMPVGAAPMIGVRSVDASMSFLPSDSDEDGSY